MLDARTLILTNSKDATADYLCDRLSHAGVIYSRFDTDLPLGTIDLNLAGGDLQLSLDQLTIRPDDIQTVVYRRPKPFMPSVSGDSFQLNHASDEWAEAIEGFLAHVPPDKWINYPSRNFNASHKVQQLTCASECGLRVPQWIVTTLPEKAELFLNANGQDVIAKPLASGFIERDQPVNDTLIYTRSIDKSHLSLFKRLPGCPVLFQSRVCKKVDIRLIALDGRLVAVSMVAKEKNGTQRLDIRRDNMQDVQYTQVPVPLDVENGVARLMLRYSLRFAAIDFAIDVEGKWIFFEVNPNGQWAWLDLVGASDIGQLFIDVFRSPP